MTKFENFRKWLNDNNFENIDEIIQNVSLGNDMFNSSHEETVDFEKESQKFKEKIITNQVNKELQDELQPFLENDTNLKGTVNMHFNILQSLNLYYDYLVSDNDKNEIIKTAKEFYDNEGRVTGAINKIFYGAPGTGKSYKVDSLFNNFERVTFHPEYTYFDFVGGLRPVQNEDKSVSYSFVPGIFTDILIKAVENKTKNIGIIIEEINRANTAAVFGDLFQLLDRDDDGQSKYIIKNKDICDYIENKTGKKCESIYIPSNMSIVATMNSADQGVFVMDSAFKRRWQFEYMPISFDAEDLKDVKIAGFDMYWKDFGAILNEHLSSEEVDVDEDKLIGQRFINKHDMQDKDLIASKLLIYLWDDVVRYNRQSLFKESKVFSNLIEHFKESGIDCFVDPLKKKLEVAKNEGNNYYD
ncbi:MULTISPECIES: AAA family ATPase [Staphylococcus]|nr:MULTISPECIES: AAA family ATPase [Staphylococcus]MBM6508018.1 AAA family ATPase [Staphylococcus pasteuri]QQT20074.1 AAA family ATPase [Staphylococcus pasteuri]VXC86037.1 conserved hypothetical protein [Staphylococcus sp. 8AQ]